MSEEAVEASTSPNEEDVGALLQRMAQHSSDVEVQLEGWERLRAWAGEPLENKSPEPEDEAVLKAAEAAVLLQNPDVMGKVWTPFLAVVMRAQDGDLGAFQCMVRMMQAFPEDGEVQRMGCHYMQWAVHNVEKYQAEVIIETGLLSDIMQLQYQHVDAGRMEGAEFLGTLLWHLAALESDDARFKLIDQGCVEFITFVMRSDLQKVEFQLAGCGALSNLALASTRIKQRLLLRGVGQQLVESMRAHCYDVGIWDSGCRGLKALARIGKEHRGKLLLEGEAIEIVGQGLLREELPLTCREGALWFLDYMSELPDARRYLLDLKVHKSVMYAGVGSPTLFGPACKVLSRLPGGQLLEVLKDDGEEQNGAMLDLLAAADSRRFKKIDVLKDVFFPVVDVVLDAINVIDFFQHRHYIWMTLLLCGLVFNSVASALHACGRHRPGLATLNLLTFGTGGQVSEAIESWRDTTKTELLITQKMIEGVESMLSLLVSADAIAVAGNLPNYPSLGMRSVSLKWISVLFSLLCLSLLSTDLDKQAIQEADELAHLRGSISGCGGQLKLMAFHLSEVLAALVLLPFASATRSFRGILILAAVSISLAWIISFRASGQWEGNWVITTIGLAKNWKVTIRENILFMDNHQFLMETEGVKAKIHTEPPYDFVAILFPSGDVMHWDAGGYNPHGISGSTVRWDKRSLCRQETLHIYDAGWQSSHCAAGLARRMLAFIMYTPTCLALNILLYLPNFVMLQLALLRAVLLVGTWSVVGVRVATNEAVLHELRSPQVMALMGMAATGLVAQLILLEQQRCSGRYAHAALYNLSPEEKEEMRKQADYQLLAPETGHE